VLELSSVASLNVTKRRIGIDDSNITQILQCHQVFAFSQSVQPSATEGQCAEILVDDVQKMLGF
jgi:hypothetical protein